MGQQVQEKHQVMGFVDEEPNHEISIPSEVDPTMHYETYEDASLAAFFERPIPIDTQTWTVNAHLDVNFNPWYRYFSNASVLKKLDNFHMMRCKLHIKVMINGSPFHYSRLFVAYQPLDVFNTNHTPVAVGISRPCALMKISNLPHGTINPSVQEPLELECPFIYPLNYITVEDMVTGVDPLQRLGKLRFMSSDVLQAVSATAATEIHVTTFAWATDVELVVPTNAIVSAGKKNKSKRKSHSTPKKVGTFTDRMKGKVSDLAQVSIPADEAKDGMISSVSSVVANVAGRLTDVPFIGDAAKLTKGVANGVTQLARFFGYGRPPVLSDPIFVKRQPFSNVANTQGNETIAKLAFDPKQSTTIDPAVAAMGPEDELALTMFTNKETLFSTVLWESADAPDAELFWANVTPTYSRQYSASANTEAYQVTSLCYAAQPFKYWSGSLIYRFQFVASPYHTGRVRITFEPNGAAYSASNYNTTYSQVVDLAGGTDVSFIVPWAQTAPYKKVENSWFNQFFIPPSGIKNYDDSTCNGIVYLTVLNPLISPDALKGVSINCYVRGGDDFELSVPSSTGITPGENWPLIAASSEGNATLVPEKLTSLFGETMTPEEINKKNSVFFGEVISSFRPLMKRYVSNGARWVSGSTNATNFTSAELAGLVYPARKGPVTSPSMDFGTYAVGVETAFPLVDYPYNFNDTCLINYVSAAFLGTRGGIRWKFIPQVPGSSSPTMILALRDDQMAVNTATGGGLYDLQVTNQYDYQTQDSAFLNGNVSTITPDLWTGSTVFPARDGQPGIELEIPWYNPNRFCTTDVNSLGTYNTVIGDDFSNSRWKVMSMNPPTVNAATENSMCVFTMVATAEDFTCNCYLGPPLQFIDARNIVPNNAP